MELPGTLVCSTTCSAAQVLIASMGLASAVRAVQFFLNANYDPPYGQLPFRAA
jgi:hypothetical protein